MASQLKPKGPKLKTAKKPPAAQFAGPKPKSAKAESSLDVKAFDRTVADLTELNAKSAEIRGKIGAKVKGAEEDFAIDRKALKMFLTIDKMEPAARSAMLLQFDAMRDHADWPVQPGLFGDDGGEEE